MTKISGDLMKKYELPTFDEWQQAINAGVYDNFLELYQMFLMKTDHIPNKIIESLVENLATASVLEMPNVIIGFFKDIKVTYNEVLTARKTAREEINRTEAELAEVTSKQ